MNGPLRNRQGCWTCRLRKKKCDEGRPQCLLCESLSITCYGYGPKPDWMDNGEKEKAIANELKEIVKHTSRRKDTAKSTKRHESVSKLVPKSTNSENSSSIPELNHLNSVATLSKHVLAQDSVDIISENSPMDITPAEQNDSTPESIFSIPADESILLMHFMDTVFPLQFPAYRPKAQEGGRGWLLSLLLHIKPFYHIALALSTFHRRTITQSDLSHSSQITSLIEQEKHLESCLKLLGQSTQSCSTGGTSVAIPVVQLVFFEVITGNGNAWQTHLRVATDMYERAHEQNFMHRSLADASMTIINEGLSVFGYEPEIVNEVVSFRFLNGTILWLDIISSITTGTRPRLLSYHTIALASDSQIKLEDIIGCQNRVMRQIGRIAELYERMTQVLQQGQLGRTEFEKAACTIGGEIQYDLGKEPLESSNPSGLDKYSEISNLVDLPKLITRIYSYTAFIYLHLVIYGFQKTEILNSTISKVLKMLQDLVPTHLLASLICPLYIIGCAARQEDEQFLRRIFSTQPLHDLLLQHRSRILPILEDIWIRRRTTSEFGWKDSLELVKNVLLV